jgi:protein subunit release factor A
LNNFKIESYRSSGPGGQRKNKKETAIRITHLPTGITVIATEYRSQAQNKKLAVERMYAKLRKLNQRKKPRMPTRVPRAVKNRRLNEKKKHSQKKSLRGRAEPE